LDSKLEQELQQEADEVGQQKPISGGRAVVGIIVLLVVAFVVAVLGIIPRMHAEKSLAKETDATSATNVAVEAPRRGDPVQDVVLPGNIYAYTDSPIYARTDGYLQKWFVDIGAHVRKGDLLATISTPEVDQQLLQAKADLSTATTNAGIASVTAARYQGLLPSAAVSKQATQTATSQSEAAKSGVASAQANVQRVQKLQAFQRIYAPFTGVITARNVDVGQLITAGSSGGAASQLFHMAAVNTLRVYVAVPQDYGDSIKAGMDAALTFNEYPGKIFEAKVVRTSHYVDPASRTLLVEVDYDNRKNLLTPGTFTQVHFRLPSGVPALMVPASALLFRSEGLRVATVVDGPNGVKQAKLVPVILGNDDGRMVQVVDGLQDSSQVIQSPPDSLVDGEPVAVMTPQHNGNQNGGQS
jgi:RND family efflux transporter MFP subunit